jgi:acyl-[acyl-carrier-protein]-phospholipid O-acyltransferase/long-chain-fatty-acid--[acyl-carrier-protein] ligase
MTEGSDSTSSALRGLLAAQFLGAFNDNAWKIIVALLAMRAIRITVPTGPALDAASQSETTLAYVAFTLPLLLVSIPAGYLTDRYSKRSVIVAMKAVEVVLMGAGTALLLLNPAARWPLLVVLGLMGAQSALFSPAKYGILPDLVPHEQLTDGNARLETWTFLAIIAGSALGGWLLAVAGQSAWIAGGVLFVLAVLGLAAALRIPRVAPSRADIAFVSGLKSAAAAILGDRALLLAVLGAAYFWTVASLLGQDVLVYIKSALLVSDAYAGIPLALFGLGVAGGAILASRLSNANVEIGLIPLGAVGLGVFTLILAALAPAFPGLLVLMTLLGVASGLLIVPLDSLIQWRAPRDLRGSVIALANILIFGGVLLGSLLAEALSRLGFGARAILTAVSLVTLAGTVWALRVLPQALLRLVLVLLTHTFYRLQVVGRSNVPAEGGALLVPNHVSFVDGLMVLASLDRRVRFVVEGEYFQSALVGPALRALGAIPIASTGGPRVILRALRDAGECLDRGEIVCIFAEGQITRTGMMNAFRRGLERLIKGRNAAIIPVHLDRLWGSVFSRSRGRFVTKIPERIPYRVTVSFGEPLPRDTPIHEVRRAVSELGAVAAALRRKDRRPLHHAFVRGARRHPFEFAFGDTTGRRMSRLRVAAGATALARALRPRWAGQDRVGVLLPPSIAGALVNLAAPLAGRATVNLNFTAGRGGMESAARQAGLRTVVTSRAFLDKAKIELPSGVEPIWIEEVQAAIGPIAGALAAFFAVAAPIRLLEKACGAARAPSVDDVVTVIFSSGSTGEPKGVVLTHFNVAANVDALAQVYRVDSTDRLLGILPLFHSFGYLLLWFSAAGRLGTVFHPNPLDAAAIGAAVHRFRVTLLVATASFLQIYMRRCTPAQFGSLRLVLVGAEKLQPKLADAFEDQFGLRPLEGYGTTECAPVIAVSTLDFRAPGFYQPGSRRGFVGMPLPGVAVRVADPETFAILPPNTPGMLLVKGPNVMRGYLGRDDLTGKAMRDGWYVTGDIAVVDEDGFIRITDRLSRFSKIGGEMVPHGRIEEALQEIAAERMQVFAVTSIPDEKKGERLAVLTTLPESRVRDIAARLQASGLPNLFIPRLDHFVTVEKIPLLGTGKLDLREARRLAIAALVPAQ